MLRESRMRSLLLCTLRTHFEVPGARNSGVTQVSQKYQVDPPAEIPEILDDTVPERSLNTPKHSENCFPLLYGNDYLKSGLVRQYTTNQKELSRLGKSCIKRQLLSNM